MTEIVGTTHGSGAQGSGAPGSGHRVKKGAAEAQADPGSPSSAIHTTPRRAPLRRGHLGSPRRRHDQLARRLGRLQGQNAGVEFPQFWSINATNIITQQVLPRGGRLRRSASPALRQLIDRVVTSLPPRRAGARLLRHRGRRRGVRPTAGLDAAAPGVQLQLAGLVRRQRPSSPRPSLSTPASSSPSTTRWSRWSTGTGRRLIFKGGSGSGLNYPRIRSSQGLLSSRRRRAARRAARFMRGADASAGTIKSGGATRRAAKMVVLDIDEADIGEYVLTQVQERSARSRECCETRPSTWTSVASDITVGAVPEREQLGAGHRRVHARRRVQPRPS